MLKKMFGFYTSFISNHSKAFISKTIYVFYNTILRFVFKSFKANDFKFPQVFGESFFKLSWLNFGPRRYFLFLFRKGLSIYLNDNFSLSVL
jgi:hypothetical protein